MTKKQDKKRKERNSRVLNVDEHVTRLEDKVDGADINTAQERRDTLRDKWAERSSSRRDVNSTGSESSETTELKLRQHLHEAFKIQRDVADSIRESVRKRWRELDGTVHRVSEQFPQDVTETWR
ncbi:hypothetical protein DPMN_146785 [Dreissena polymorpha]|uniref:Uncharacterized protein n=1 Tax=Dreissena polymorpha TaxID=45954 RepID=A0A9D4J2E7_DREPO|nr:hypothetical protein DPMN_146785 [Dreissena polymorpha]